MIYNIEWTENAAVHLQVFDQNRQLVEDVPHALTVREACQLLKRSQRHLYRYIQRGWLKPMAKFSGEFFFKKGDIEALKLKTGGQHTSLPSSLAPLFPEYELRSLHVERDSDIILSRILERGGKHELRWALRHYPQSDRKRFLTNQGQRLLSPRALRFWSWLWHVPTDKNKFQWRKSGLSYGGLE